MTDDYRKCAEVLSDLAAGQGGYFTATQAIEAGYADSQHVYHVRTGHWEKAHRGIYRLAGMPKPGWPELVVWALWSRDRDGSPQGVYSGETALAIHGAIERPAGPLHMTVPRSFRKNCEIPGELVLHKEDLAPEDIEGMAGFRVLTLRAALARSEGHPEYERISGQARYLPKYYDRYTPPTPRDYNDTINAGED